MLPHMLPHKLLNLLLAMYFNGTVHTGHIVEQQVRQLVFESFHTSNKLSNYQTCIPIGGSQLLCATFLETFESQIFAGKATGTPRTDEYQFHWQSGALIDGSGASSCLSTNSLTASMLSSICTVRGRPLPLLRIVVPVSRSFLNNLFSPCRLQPLSGNSSASFFAP